MNAGIYIYDEAEVLDFSGPFEVFYTASRICTSGDPFKVFLIGETGEIIRARGGFHVTPDYGFHNHPQIDILIIAGGVHTKEMAKPTVINWISKVGVTSKIVSSVCTGVFLLAEARIVTTHNVTTHWEDISDLRRRYSRLVVHESKRWVDDRTVVTSSGISAGIDMCLHLVSRLHSSELAEKTAKQMEFNWTKVS